MLNKLSRSIKSCLARRPPDPSRASPHQTEPPDLKVLLAWAFVAIPIAWGLLATFRDALRLFP